MGILLRLFGGRVLHKAVSKRIEHSPLSPKFGFSLMRDRRIPVLSKLLALALGGAVVSALIALELPIEAVMAALIVGIVPEGIIDGMEAVIRLQANGAITLERTLYLCISRAILFDSPTTPSLAAA